MLIFPNSWSMPQIEYIVKALQLAESGYVTFEYETRGWWASGGQIDVAGPLDRRDISSVIDFVESNADKWNANTSAIAFIGISYGAGLSLEAAGFEPRVKAAVSMSGWVNLTLGLYKHNTPNTAWVKLLEVTADIVGHPSSELAELIHDLDHHENMSSVFAFAAKRSSISNVSFTNGRNTPILISNNFLDRLFKPQDMINYYNMLTTPKMILLNHGVHAEAETAGKSGQPELHLDRGPSLR